MEKQYRDLAHLEEQVDEKRLKACKRQRSSHSDTKVTYYNNFQSRKDLHFCCEKSFVRLRLQLALVFIIAFVCRLFSPSIVVSENSS